MNVPHRPVDEIFGGRREAIDQNLCATCGKVAESFRDEISQREYHISGMCQECQDEIFGKPSSEPETLGPCGCVDYHMADCPTRTRAADDRHAEEMRAMGVEDYFETHDVDDYKEFEDNEAWLDMQGEGEWHGQSVRHRDNRDVSGRAEPGRRTDGDSRHRAGAWCVISRRRENDEEAHG